jgi:hypothetical protein
MAVFYHKSGIVEKRGAPGCDWTWSRLLSEARIRYHLERSAARNTLFIIEAIIFLGARHFQSAGHLILVLLVRIKESQVF